MSLRIVQTEKKTMPTINDVDIDLFNTNCLCSSSTEHKNTFYNKIQNDLEFSILPFPISIPSKKKKKKKRIQIRLTQFRFIF